VVEGRRIELGNTRDEQDGDDSRAQGLARIAVKVDGRPAGRIVMADHLREDARAAVERLRGYGIRHVAMVSGDRRTIAESVARQVGLDEVYAERTPEQKL